MSGEAEESAKETKQVRFEGVPERKDSPAGRPKSTRRPQQPHNPAKVGKADPKRDIPLFLGIVAFLFLIAYMTKDIGSTEKKSPTKRSIKDLQEALKKTAAENRAREMARKRTMECDLFITKSSIPGAGVGVFAGKRFEEGDDVMMHSGLFFPVNDQEGDESKLLVSQAGFLLNHHPYLANLQGGPTWIQHDDVVPDAIGDFKATRVIEPGEELFLSYSDHPQNVVGKRSGIMSLPTLEEYQLADDIVQDEISTQRRGARERRTGSHPAGGTAALLLVKRTAERFNKQVGMLLPATKDQLEKRDLLDTPIAYAALQNRTVYSLETDGMCLDDVEVKQSHVNAPQKGLFARRAIRKGTLISPAPLYAIRNERTCSASAGECGTTTIHPSLKHCFGHKDSSLLLCPLSSAAFIQASTDSDPKYVANAVYKWNTKNSKSVNKMSLDDIMKSNAMSLSFDIVALRDIQPGEEIRMDIVRAGMTANESIEVSDGIFQETWMDSRNQ